MTVKIMLSLKTHHQTAKHMSSISKSINMLKVKGTRTRNNINILHGHGIVTGYCCKESKKKTIPT